LNSTARSDKLENGMPLRMVVVNYMGVEIDTPEDLERAANLL